MLERIATPPRILLFGWSLFVVYAYPGFMSYDSIVQLTQARKLEPIGDWHPPMMAELWRLTDHVIAGPFPMLVIQSSTFLVGVYSLFGRVMKPRAAAITACCVLVFPPILAPMAVIWKDSQMAGFLVAGIAALLSDRRRWRIAGWFLLGASTAMRYNAAAATLPIIGLLAFRDVAPTWKRAVFAGAAWIAVTLAALGANRVATQREEHVFQSSLALSDIAGTLRWDKQLDSDQILADYGDLPWTSTDNLRSRVRAAYSPANTFLELTAGPHQLFTMPMTDRQLAAVSSAWLDLVIHHPRAYVHYRSDIFRTLLAVRGSHDGGIWEGFTGADWSETSLQHRARHSEAQRVWLDVVEKLGPTWLFRPWIYLAIAIAFLVLARRDLEPFAILASGVLNELALFVATPSTDTRYSHWLMIGTVVGGVMLFVLRKRRI